MMRFHWLILTCFSFFLFCNPAHAGKLLLWRFESSQNRLIFRTDKGVQPTAQLLSNPTRLVIDLPGTVLGRPTVNENYQGVVTNVRIGQFDPSTTRLVVELAPGYVVDPQGIKIRGISPNQWTVDLPKPERNGNFNNSPNSNQNPSPYDQSQNSTSINVNNTRNNTSVRNPNPNPNSNSNSNQNGLRVTNSGLLIDLNGSMQNRIEITRSRDQRKMEFKLHGINFPNNLPKGWNVNQYGISNIGVYAENNLTVLTFNVDPKSPDWQGSFIRSGGLVLWPQGGMNVLEQKGLIVNNSNNQQSNKPNSTNNNRSNPTNQKTVIEAIEINNTQLLVRGNQFLQARGNWNRNNGVYELRINNATLSPQFKSPQLRSNSPISRLRIWQPDSNTVVILAQPAVGVRFSQINQPGDKIVFLPLTRYSNSVTQTPIRSNFPEQNDPYNDTNSNPSDYNNLPPLSNPSRPLNRSVKSKTLVIIDPGHGGKDPGAIGIGGIQEKQIVMSISKQVAQILEQQGIQVRLTRNSDYFISLEGRTQMANRADADVFVSIHANSAGISKPHVSGLETYYFQSGRSLAAIIHRNILNRVDVNDRKVRQARFYVLRKSDMPSVLVETGFVTGSEDAAKLSNPSYQRKMAEGIAYGIIEYLQRR